MDLKRLQIGLSSDVLLQSIVATLVAQRRAEMGVRIALGAGPLQILTLVSQQGIGPAGVPTGEAMEPWRCAACTPTRAQIRSFCPGTRG